MILIDHLFDTTPYTHPHTPKCFRNTLASHMISSLPGPSGTHELLAFASLLGLCPSWLQHPGTYREHFDLVQSKHRRALALGAKLVDVEELVEVELAKRRALQSSSYPSSSPLNPHLYQNPFSMKTLQSPTPFAILPGCSGTSSTPFRLRRRPLSPYSPRS